MLAKSEELNCSGSDTSPETLDKSISAPLETLQERMLARFFFCAYLVESR